MALTLWKIVGKYKLGIILWTLFWHGENELMSVNDCNHTKVIFSCLAHLEFSSGLACPEPIIQFSRHVTDSWLMISCLLTCFLTGCSRTVLTRPGRVHFCLCWILSDHMDLCTLQANDSVIHMTHKQDSVCWVCWVTHLKSSQWKELSSFPSTLLPVKDNHHLFQAGQSVRPACGSDPDR